MTTRTDLTRLLDAHLARAARRVRARRLVVTLAAGGLAVAVVGALAASWEAAMLLAGEAGDAETLTAPLRPWLVAGLLTACAIAWTRGVSRTALARDVDRRLGLEDRTAAALAVARGDIASALGDRVLADGSAALDAASAELDRVFPARPRRGVLALLRAGSVLVALWVALVLASRLLGSGGGGRSVPFLPGEAPVPGETARGADGAPLPPAPEEPSEPESAAAPEEPEEPDANPPEEAPEPSPPPEPEVPPAGPAATAQLILSADVFSPGEDVLAIGVAKPGAGLTAPAGFELGVEIDGEPFGTGESVALDPAEERGALTPLRLGRLPGAAEALRPGEHEAVLVLAPVGGGPAVRSEPQRFRVRGDQDDDTPQGSPPPPEPRPEPQPEQPPPPQPEAPQPEEPGGDGAPPDEAEPPPLPEATEKKVVVPLFGDGEEVRKTGPRLVLVPGGGPESPTRRADLTEALDEAQRRAEAAVDRAGVRAEDRDLVRRYFERLRRLAGESR